MLYLSRASRLSGCFFKPYSHADIKFFSGKSKKEIKGLLYFEAEVQSKTIYCPTEKKAFFQKPISYPIASYESIYSLPAKGTEFVIELGFDKEIKDVNISLEHVKSLQRLEKKEKKLQRNIDAVSEKIKAIHEKIWNEALKIKG